MVQARQTAVLELIQTGFCISTADRLVDLRADVTNAGI